MDRLYSCTTPPGPRLPPTPESVDEPTFLPHVRAPLPSLSAPGAVDAGERYIAEAPESDGNAPDYRLEGVDHASVRTGINVLLHTRDALANLHHLYATSEATQRAFGQAIALMAGTVGAGGRIVVTGMGKSGKVGEKMVATCNSLGVRATYLHAADAMHGDLGGIASNDAMLLITNSARTPELVAMIPHLPPSLPLMVMTAAIPALTDSPQHPPASGYLPKAPERLPSSPTNPLAAYPLFAHRSDEAHLNLILPAPLPVSEVAAFGVPAPITSTSVALALGDALAMAAAEKLHGTSRVAEVFRKGHPGGWIGQS